MTTLLNIWFLCLALAAAMAYRWVSPRLGTDGRAWVLSAVSVGFLWKFGALSAHAGEFALWLAAGIGLALLTRRAPSRGRGLVLLVAVAVLVAVMMVFRYPNYTAALAGEHPTLRGLAAMGWIGLSFASFRAVDMLMAARSERTRSFSPAVALAYLLYFPPVIAGPINRFAPFAKDLEAGPAPFTRAEARILCFRFAIGAVKLVVLSRLAWYWSIPGLPADLDGIGRWQAILGVYAYFAYIYFEFAGYTDMVIAVSALFGVRMPENFTFPLLAVNIQDFWNRWHISLSQWCRDHIFFPLVATIARRWPAVPPLAGAMASIVVTFLFIGTWHGDSLNWVLYGLYHGAGLSLWMGWRKALRRFAPAVEERLDRSRLAKAVAIAMTASFVSWGLLLTLSLPQARRIIEISFSAG